MKRQLQLMVNGRPVTESVEPRTHLTDLLREHLRLTGTHLRCEQGVCGACTILIDGQPARSCITYATLCETASITTIEGLEDDPVIVRLRRAFSIEHGLQCGFCTPGMLVTARDIVMRIPDASEARIRLELSGNLCRCTGYAGIVRAIQRVLAEHNHMSGAVVGDMSLGPVGARPAQQTLEMAVQARVRAPSSPETAAASAAAYGLGSNKPNISIRQSFTVKRKPEQIWSFLADIERVAACLPGAQLDGPPINDHVQGRFSARLGPIKASFAGAARINREIASYSGKILGSGRDATAASRAIGEIEYRLSSLEGGAATRVDLEIRALIAGPLAQFGRSGVMEDLTKRIVDLFAANMESRLSGRADEKTGDTTFHAGGLLKDLIKARFVALFMPIRRLFRS